MADFEKLQSIWNKQQPAEGVPDISSIRKENKTTKDKLTRSLFFRGGVLAATGVIILISLFLNSFGITSPVSFITVAGLGILCFLQGLVELYNGNRLLKIDALQEPAIHIHAWENYFELRKRILAISGPVYFVLFNLCMVLFSREALQSYSPVQRVGIGVAYCIWIIFGWFVVRRRTTAKEVQRITNTIGNLKKIQAGLK